MSPDQHAYYRGAIIPSIMTFLGISPDLYGTVAPKIHTAIKRCFEIRSLSDLSVAEFQVFAEKLRMLFVREYGWTILEPDEKDVDIEQMTMHEFLIFKKLIPDDTQGEQEQS
jgi:hypothetical protein